MRPPSLRVVSDTSAISPMTASSTPLGVLNNARKLPTPTMRSGALAPDLQARIQAFQASRQSAPRPSPRLAAINIPAPHSGPVSDPPTPTGALVGGIANLRLPPSARPSAPNWSSTPMMNTSSRTSPKPSLSARRNMNLGGLLPTASPPPANPVQMPAMQNFETNRANNGGGESAKGANPQSASIFKDYEEFVDTKTGRLTFKNKAVIHGKGIDFTG